MAFKDEVGSLDRIAKAVESIAEGGGGGGGGGGGESGCLVLGTTILANSAILHGTFGQIAVAFGNDVPVFVKMPMGDTLGMFPVVALDRSGPYGAIVDTLAVMDRALTFISQTQNDYMECETSSGGLPEDPGGGDLNFN